MNSVNKKMVDSCKPLNGSSFTAGWFVQIGPIHPIRKKATCDRLAYDVIAKKYPAISKC